MRLKRVLMNNMSGDDVSFMQTKLKQFGFFTDRIDGYFSQNTLVAVTQFQREVGIKIDGIVSLQTWSNLLSYGVIKPEPSIESNRLKDIPNKISFIGEDGLQIYDNLLPDFEYYKNETKKDTIWLHSTSGGSRPDWRINSWEKDSNVDGSILKMGTSFVIGRKSSSDDILWDGKILKAFDDIYWAKHIDLENDNLNSISIGIELCNYGYLILGKDGVFYNSVNKPVNQLDVVELEQEFRGYKYYERYTDSQIESLRKLIIYLKDRWMINIETGIYDEKWFEYDEKWIKTGGLRTNSQINKNKIGIFPQLEMIQMLNSL